MRAMRTLTEAEFDAWAVLQGADGPRAATKSDLLQRGVKVLDQGDGSVHLLDARLDHSQDGRRHTDGTVPGALERVRPIATQAWKQLARILPAPARARVFRAEVIRSADGSVRDELDRGRSLPARVKHDEETVAAARALVDDPGHPAELRRVSMAEIQDGDVVVEVDLPPVRIQGECER